MTEHTTSESLLLAVCHPDQCCAGWCVDEIGLHDVDRDTAEVAAERACMWLADRLAAVQADRDDLLAVIQPVLDANKTLLKTMARADRERESAEAEIARLRARLGAVEALAEDADPEWHVPYCGSLLDADEFDQHACVPVTDLRAALDSPTSHTQQEAEE